MTNPREAPSQILDVLVIGAGPVGLACAIEAQRAGLSARVVEKGALVNSLVGYPVGMEFFSTPDLIEIGGHPFPTRGYKPTREEALEYYRIPFSPGVQPFTPVVDSTAHTHQP